MSDTGRSDWGQADWDRDLENEEDYFCGACEDEGCEECLDDEEKRD